VGPGRLHALVQRLHGAGPFLEEVVGQLLTGAGEAPAWHGRVLRVADSTSLSNSGANLLRLALARGPPGGFSLRQTSGWVSLLEIAELSNPGVHYRLKQVVAFLAALVGRLLAVKTPGAPCPRLRV
jgi:hypothetical protein